MAVISKADFARELGVSRTRVTQFSKMGMPVRPDGKLVREKALAWVRSNILPPEDAAAHDQSGFATQRARLTAARADLAEMDRLTKAGKLIDRAAVVEMNAKVATLVKTRILAIPSKVAPRLVGKTAPEIAAILTTECREALEAIANTEVTAEGQRAK